MKATPARDAAPDRSLIDSLAERGFDAAVIFTSFSQSSLPAALTCWHAGIPLRLAHCRENPYQLLTDWVRETDSEAEARHEVRRQLDLVAAVGATTPDERLAVAVPAAARDDVEALLSAERIDRSRPWAVVHPGATAPSRRYPAEFWSAACRELVRDHDLQLVLTQGRQNIESAVHGRFDATVDEAVVTTALARSLGTERSKTIASRLKNYAPINEVRVIKRENTDGKDTLSVIAKTPRRIFLWRLVVDESGRIAELNLEEEE